MWMIGLMLLLAALVFVIKNATLTSVNEDKPWPLIQRPLLTPREQAFHQRLTALCPGHFIFTQVALSQLIDVKRDDKNNFKYRNRFNQLVADFVVVRPDYSILAVIEVDDRSHQQAHRILADARKTKALQSAGLRLIRIPAGEFPSDDELRHHLQAGEYESSTVFTQKHINPETVAVIRVVSNVIIVVIVFIASWISFNAHLTNLHPIINNQSRATNMAPTPAIPRIPTPTFNQISQQERDQQALAQQQVADALAKRKAEAWSAYFTPAASCENPHNFDAQVECGNRYMRAKHNFEEQWKAAHPDTHP